MNHKVTAALLCMIGLGVAEDAPEFSSLKEARTEILRVRQTVLDAVKEESLVIPSAFVDAELIRNNARRAWLEERFAEADKGYVKAWSAYRGSAAAAKTETARLSALREKRPPELRVGSKQRKAIRLGMEWLAQHQDAVGRWDGRGFMKHDPEKDQCNGPAQPWFDVGVTGLALLTFLEAGYTDRENHYATEVYRGLHWLISQQDAGGVFGSRESEPFHYNHAIATLAVARAFALTKDERFRKPLHLATEYILSARTTDKGWRYRTRGKDSDTSITAWCMRALIAARQAGIGLDMKAAERGTGAWISTMTTGDGRIGYFKPGEVARPGDKLEFLADRSRAMTAAGAIVRVLLQRKTLDKKQLALSLDRCLERPPVWKRGGDIDMYYWYHGTIAASYDRARARKWKKALHKAVFANQHGRGSGARMGSWDPVGVWGADGGRVYSTALLTLSLIHAG